MAVTVMVVIAEILTAEDVTVTVTVIVETFVSVLVSVLGR